MDASLPLRRLSVAVTMQGATKTRTVVTPGFSRLISAHGVFSALALVTFLRWQACVSAACGPPLESGGAQHGERCLLQRQLEVLNGVDRSWHNNKDLLRRIVCAR